MGCCTKTFLFAINFLVFVAGGVVVALASMVINENTQFGILLGEGVVTIPIIILVFGLAVLLLGFFGCCGAMKESSCLLYTYAAIISLLLIGQIVAVVFIFLKGDEFFEKTIEKPLEKYQDQYNDREDIKNAWDVMQHDLQCCGVNNYTDWKSEMGLGNVPDSCCIANTADCGTGYDVEKVFPVGCYEKLKVDFNNYEVAGTALGLALLQMICVICACNIAKKSGGHEYV